MKNVCKPPRAVISSFLSADRTQSDKFAAAKVSDFRLNPPPGGTVPPPPAPVYPASVGGSCQEVGKLALTLSPTCGQIEACEAQLQTSDNYTSPHGVQCSSVAGGPLICIDPVTGLPATLTITTTHTKTITAYPFFGNCSDSTSVRGLHDDLQYVASSTNAASASLGAPIGCTSSSSSCLLLDVPLLQQDSSDLKSLLGKKTGIYNPADVGFCAPTSLSMLLAGIRNQTSATLGNVLDSGPSYSDPLDASQAQNWAASIFRSGQMLGTDWWVGGSSTLQYKALLQNNLGKGAGLLNDLMGTSNDYSNQNFINFTNQHGGIVQLSVAQDTTGNLGPASEFHSLLVAGHAGGHLRVLDPWGRMYLVDISSQPRNAIFYQVNASFFNYADPTGKIFTISDGVNTAIYTFQVAPKVGDNLPAYQWSNPSSRQAAQMFVSAGALTEIDKSGTAVPTLKHVSGDQGFVYFSPQNQAQLLPGTEVAAMNPDRAFISTRPHRRTFKTSSSESDKEFAASGPDNSIPHRQATNLTRLQKPFMLTTTGSARSTTRARQSRRTIRRRRRVRQAVLRPPRWWGSLIKVR